MQIQYHKHYSGHLNRDMEFKVYGHGGKPVLFIPCQAGRFFDFENFHMIDHWAQWIEEGRCTVYSIDTIDNEAWAAQGADNRWRTKTMNAGITMWWMKWFPLSTPCPACRVS